MMSSSAALEGYWLPADLRRTLLESQTAFEQLAYAGGRPSAPGAAGAVVARWPILNAAQWQLLLAGLQINRGRLPQGAAYWQRLQQALQTAARRFADPQDPLRRAALNSLPGYTGYAPQMIELMAGALSLMSLEVFPAAYAAAQQLDQRALQDWQAFPGLSGRLRFFPEQRWRQIAARWRPRRPLFSPLAPPSLVLGFGAGNVPGTALLITFLSQAAALTGGTPPAVLVRNSRQEPIFSPLVLQALEEADPDLVAAVAVLVWDYEQADLQAQLLGQADLAIAAASDQTITQLQSQAAAASRHGKAPLRWHAHGHKVSFAAIGQTAWQSNWRDADTNLAYADIVALLAALDSAFWDQNGCLSARVHFVESSGEPRRGLDYARRLEAQLRRLSLFLPRGNWPRQPLLDRFDRYKQLEASGQVQVLSQYGDDYLVAWDERPLTASSWFQAVNDCQGRTVLVRPVASLEEIPRRYLRWLPPANLQTLSVALGPGQGADETEFLRFAAECGRCGVTALRSVGRGAFPQLAYSWDGFLPLDVTARRPPGHFTAIEFDQPADEILSTFRQLLAWGAASALTS